MAPLDSVAGSASIELSAIALAIQTRRTQRYMQKWLGDCMDLVPGVGWLVGTSLLNGFVLMMLWTWILVPAFGVPVASFWGATGIVLGARFLMGNAELGDYSHEKSVKYGLFVGAVVLFGWLISLFMSM